MEGNNFKKGLKAELKLHTKGNSFTPKNEGNLFMMSSNAFFEDQVNSVHNILIASSKHLKGRFDRTHVSV